MQVKLETISPIKKKITVELSVEKVAKALEKAYQSVQKKAKMKGFRDGKVPMNLIELHFKDSVEAEAKEMLMDESYVEALKSQSVFPVSRPVVDPGPFAKDKVFSYTAEFEVHPEIEVKHYDGISLEKTERDINDELIDRRIEAMRQSMAQLEPALEGAAIGKGKVAFLSFKGTADGKAFKGSESDNFILDYGTGSMLAEFEEQLKGMKKGDSRHIEFDYPKDHFNPELAGKHGVFDVTIKDLKNKIVPEPNEDFAKEVGFKSMEELRADLKKRMDSAVEFEAKNELIEQVMEHLITKNKMEVPESVVASELKAMFDNFVRELSRQGKKFEDTGMKIEEFIDRYKPVAEKKVKGYYLLDAVAKAEKIEVTDKDAEDRMQTIAVQVNQPFEKVQEYYKTNKLIDDLKYQIFHEKVLDFVIAKAKIKTVKPKKAKMTPKGSS